jgi:hypothetical protein
MGISVSSVGSSILGSLKGEFTEKLTFQAVRGNAVSEKENVAIHSFWLYRPSTCPRSRFIGNLLDI